MVKHYYDIMKCSIPHPSYYYHLHPTPCATSQHGVNLFPMPLHPHVTPSYPHHQNRYGILCSVIFIIHGILSNIHPIQPQIHIHSFHVILTSPHVIITLFLSTCPFYLLICHPLYLVFVSTVPVSTNLSINAHVCIRVNVQHVKTTS